MKMLMHILALSSAVIVCDCRIFRRSDGCDQSAECNFPIKTLQVDIVEGVLEQFCQEAGEFKNCVDANQLRCNDDSVKESFRTLLESEEILCSQNGSEVIHAYLESDCHTDATKKSEIDEGVDICLYDFETEWQLAVTNGETYSFDICRSVNQYSTCVAAVLTDNSCVVYSDFLRRFIQRASYPWDNCEITGDNTRRSVGAWIPPWGASKFFVK